MILRRAQQQQQRARNEGGKFNRIFPQTARGLWPEGSLPERERERKQNPECIPIDPAALGQGQQIDKKTAAHRQPAQRQMEAKANQAPHSIWAHCAHCADARRPHKRPQSTLSVTPKLLEADQQLGATHEPPEAY